MLNYKKLSVLTLVVIALALPVWAGHHGHTKDNIVETAASTGQFETLLAAATAAGLVDALSGEGPLTVFAPTDEAFSTLPAGTIASLLEEENRDKLVRILTFHVVAGQVGSDALSDNASLETLAGPAISFTQTEGGFSVEGASILTTDIAASNGIVHVIDRVMLPPAQMSRVDAERMIMAAIDKGVPMFNHGNHKGTAQIYSMTAQTLMSSAQLMQPERDRLQQAMSQMTTENSATEKAWALRHALDDVMTSIRHSQI
ncbi:fasciclin domain-containing protein [Alteromonas sp. KUL49]|uniref:fasciclin domain-containing protein n=1 Tax=Alteromonas sp. KUL49 TaxID=2480798 RepID=UPI00102EEAEB|nr:fasciclin domain-containing protein [Alteromonas sp. KUL49]TAP39190.1 fasciclin domain-containing protein [Alteromonas sp. KUL49]GEA11963.1 hypothetical protein KUL49_23380 [Alteromonas sp. KUL49]